MAENQQRFYMLKNVRISFPHFFERPIINGEEGKFGGTLMLDKKDLDHQALAKELNAAIKTLSEKKFKKLVSSDKRCLRDGDESDRKEYAGYWIVSANTDDKPVVINNSGNGVISEPDDCPIYAGCRVNAKISIWPQDNKWGRRINAQFVAVQFVGDDEALDGAYVSVDDAMDGFGGTGGDADDDFLN